MKKERSKIRKFLLRTLLLLVFFSSVLAVISRNKWVQTQLVQFITQEVHKKWGIKIDVALVEVDFLRNFHLEGVHIYDLQEDTLLRLGSIDFRFSSASWNQRSFVLSSLELQRPVFKMGYYDSSTLLNFEEVFNLIPPDSSESRPLKIKAKQIKIVNGTYVFFAHQRAFENNIKGEFNPSYLRYENINAQIGHSVLDYDASVQFDIQKFNARDRTGFVISEFKAPLKVKNGDIYLPKMFVKYGESILNGSLSIVADTAIKTGYFDEYQYHLKLKNSSLCLKDLETFAPYFADHDLKLRVDASVNGPLSHLNVSHFIGKTSRGTSLNLSYSLIGLPDTDHLKHRLKLNQTRIGTEDVQGMFPKEVWTPYVTSLGASLLDLQCEFTNNEYQHTGSIQTKQGAFKGKFAIDYSQIEKNTPFEIQGRIEQIRASLLGLKDDRLDRISANISIQGDQFDSKLNSTFVISDMSLWLNKTMLDRLSVSGNSEWGIFRAAVKSENDILRIALQGELKDINTENQEVSVNGRMGHVDLMRLGLDTIAHRISGDIELNLKGNELDHYTGSLSIKQARFQRGNTEYQLKQQFMSRPDGNNLNFKGDWLDGKISGPLKISNTPHWIEQIAHSIAPERFPEVAYQMYDSIYIDLNIPQTAWIEEFIVPGLYLSPLTLNGHYFANQNTFDLRLGPLSIEYGRIYMEKVYFSMDKTRKNGFIKSYFTTNYLLIDNTLYDTFSTSVELFSGGYQLATKLHDKAKRYALNLKGNGAINAETANLHFTETDLKIWDQLWKLDKRAMLTFKKDYWEVNDFFLADANHFLDISGYISASSSDTLKIDFGNFTPKVLTPFFPKNTFDSFDFKSNGTLALCALRGDMQFFGNVGLNRLIYRNQDFGSAQVAVKQTQIQGKVRLESFVRSGPLAQTEITGDIQFLKDKEPQLNLVGSIPQGSSLSFLKPFLDGIVLIEKGTFGGDIRITGPLNKPKTQGLLKTNEFKLGVDYLGTSYKLGGIFKITESGISTFRPLKLTDPSTGTFAWLNLALTHDNFKDFALDLKVDSIKNMRVLNTTEEMNGQFYGTAYADGKVHIHGLFTEIDMDIDLTTREKTKLFIQLPQYEENALVGSIVFVNRKAESIKNKKSIKSETEQDAIGQINLNIKVNPQAEAQFVIDKRLGDVIKGYGTGNIRLVYGRDEKLYLYGRYLIEKGEYSFSLPGVNLVKKINVNKGGSIRWDGDPLGAEVDINGSFEKKISPSTLMIASAGTNYPTTRFVSVLSMTGNLFSPNISFDLQAPELSAITGATGSEINSVLQRIRADKDETMRQSIALLLFGNFLPPSITGSTAPTANSFSSAGFAGNSISTLASSVVNDLFSKYGIPTRIQVNIDDVRNINGNSNTQLFVNSEWFLSERLRLDLNYDPTVAVLVNSVALPLNFNLEYKTSDENWRLKAFSRSNNLILQQNNATTTNGVSGNTLGTGILYRREFDTFTKKKKDK